jgi:small subunit ribosomal protein S21
MSKKQGPIMGNKVIVQNDNWEKALRLFKKKITESGKLVELKEKEFYEKPSVTHRKTKNQQARRAQRKREADALPKKLY